MLRVSEFRLFVRLPSALLVGGASTAAADSAYFCMRVETSLESASFGRLAFITSAAASIVSSRTSERDTVAISRWSGAFEQRWSGAGAPVGPFLWCGGAPPGMANERERERLDLT